VAGPFPLTQYSVEEHTREDWPAAYQLFRSRWGPVRYVGRSDTDIRRRLLEHVREGEYSYFYVEHKRDPVEAFFRECGWWHYHRSTIENDEVHPARPRGYRDACPKCSYFD
jgi:hypothetical protein